MLRRFLQLQSSGLDRDEASFAIRVITWTILAAALLFLPAMVEMPLYAGRWLSTIIAVCVVCVPVLVLDKVGRTRAAGAFLTAGMWAVTTVLIVTAGGITAPASNIYLVLVLIVGLLFGARAGTATAIVCLVTSFVLAVVETVGWLPWTVVPYTPMVRWLGLGVLLVLMTGLQYVTARTTGDAIQRMREELKERHRAEAQVRESEETLRSLERRFSIAFNANPTPSTISSLDGRFLEVNSQFLRTTGYTRDEVLGKTALELRMWPNPKDRPAVMQKLKEEGFVRGLEVDLRTKNGEHRVLLLSVEQIELDGQTCLLHSGQDITERTRAELAVRTSEEQLRALSARLRSAREEEGARIAREIHDELGGALTGLKWELEGMAAALQTPSSNGEGQLPVRERISRMAELIDATITTVRRISSDLRPSVLDDLGLIAAIEWQAQQFETRTGISCRCDIAADALDLERDQATAVFRIFQEILTNVLRHSGATGVTIAVRSESGNFVLDVTDNGRGITEQAKSGVGSLGLLGMKERAVLAGGEVSIRGAYGKGTRVVVRVPTAA